MDAALKAMRDERRDDAAVKHAWAQQSADLLTALVKSGAGPEEQQAITKALESNDDNSNEYDVGIAARVMEAIARLQPLVKDMPESVETEMGFTNAWTRSRGALDKYTPAELEQVTFEADSDNPPCCLGKECIGQTQVLADHSEVLRPVTFMARPDKQTGQVPKGRMCVLDEWMYVTRFYLTHRSSLQRAELCKSLYLHTYAVDTETAHNGFHPNFLLDPSAKNWNGLVAPFPRLDVQHIRIIYDRKVAGKSDEPGKVRVDLSAMKADPYTSKFDTEILYPETSTSAPRAQPSSSASSSSSSASSSSATTKPAIAKSTIRAARAVPVSGPGKPAVAKKVKRPRLSNPLRKNQSLYKVMTESVRRLEKDGKTNVDPSIAANDRYFCQSQRGLDLDPLPMFTARLGKMSRVAPLLFKYPVLPVLMVPPATSFSGGKAEEARYREWYNSKAWACGDNYIALGKKTKSELSPTPALSKEQHAIVFLLCQRHQLPRAFVAQFYNRVANAVFKDIGVSKSVLYACMSACATYGVPFDLAPLASLIRKRFEDQSEANWWWKLCYCRLAVILRLIDECEESNKAALDALDRHNACLREHFSEAFGLLQLVKSRGPLDPRLGENMAEAAELNRRIDECQTTSKKALDALDVLYPLLDESLLVVSELINSLRILGNARPLFDDFEFERSAPDPSCVSDCLHGAHLLPSRHTVPFLPYIEELVTNQPGSAANSPLYILYRKVLFAPSQGRMLGSVVYKCATKHPYLWPQIVCIIMSVLLGNYRGVGHLEDPGARTAIVTAWHFLEHDMTLQDPLWTQFALLISKCPTLFALILRFSLLYTARSMPALWAFMGESLDTRALWQLVFDGVQSIRFDWAFTVRFFNVCCSFATLTSQLEAAEAGLVRQYRQKLLKLCVRKVPVGFLEAISKTRKSVSPVTLRPECKKCPCHAQTSMQCFLDETEDAEAIAVLSELFPRIPLVAYGRNLDVVLIGAMEYAGLSDAEIQGCCGIIDAFYNRPRPSFMKESKEPTFLVLLQFYRKRFPRAHAFLLFFSLLAVHMGRFRRREAPAVWLYRTQEPERDCRLLICEWCENIANESFFGGYSKIRTSTLSSVDDEPVYCCKAPKTSSADPCTCGCKLIRESRVCGLPLTPVDLACDQILQTPSQWLMRCIVPSCPRILAIAPEICCYDSYLGGYRCSVCSIEWRRQQVKARVSPAWSALFEFGTAASRARRQALQAAMEEGKALRPCDICKYGQRRQTPSATAKAGRVSSGPKKKSRKNVQALKAKRELYQQPGWDFSLVVCQWHLQEEQEFFDSLSTLALQVKVEESCVRQGVCSCDNGLSTCTGRLNVPTIIKRWDIRQDSFRTASMLTQTFSRIKGLDTFVLGEKAARKRRDKIKRLKGDKFTPFRKQ